MPDSVFWFLFLTSSLLYSSVSSGCPDFTYVCMRPGCVKAAEDILSSLDESVDPCEDFYQFTCGGWRKSQEVSKEKPYYSAFSQLEDDTALRIRVLLTKKVSDSDPEFVKMIKRYYVSCMDLSKIDKMGSGPLVESLKSLGGWPVVEGEDWDDSLFSWTNALSHFRKHGYNHNILVSVNIAPDKRNNNVYTIQLDQPHLGLLGSILVRGLNDPRTAAYFNLMVKVAKKLGANNETVEAELKKALNFEISLAKSFMSWEERWNVSQSYNKYTVAKLKKLVPKVNWLRYLNGLLNRPITENEPVIVDVLDFVTRFADLITKTDRRVIANYMMWRVVVQSIFLLSGEFRAMAQEYYKIFMGSAHERPRWETCTSNHFDPAINSYFVRSYVDAESKHSVLWMVKSIQDEFSRSLESNDWMGEEAKKKAAEKVDEIRSYIGYPPWFLDDTSMSELYENLTITDDNYFNNFLSFKRMSYDSDFNKLHAQSILRKWSKATIIHAQYNPYENSIEFPAGMLRSPIFSIDRPNYMNYGALGSLIGHEMAHAFDETGRQYDKNGNMTDWWDVLVKNKFNERAQCIIDQYSNYTAENGMNVNGINTLINNIADNIGFKEAYRGYKSWRKDHRKEYPLPGLKYDDGQLFWISAARLYCEKYTPEGLNRIILQGRYSPQKFRVNGPVSNRPEFATDFQCAKGTPMNPDKKCEGF